MQNLAMELPPSYRIVQSADRLKSRMMGSDKPSLSELSLIGLSILDASTTDLCLSGLFMHHWETISLCDADEALAQTVSEISEAILRKIRNELDSACE